VITSGGGFSLFNSLPSWQSTAVNGYFSSNKNNIPSSGYKTNARGYPDISALGANYFVILNGNGYFVSGTSASAPVVAGMISLVNAARVSRGQSTFGFINPWLYANADAVVNDISSGNNFCTTNGFCCTQGFPASNGWDPVTGLGVINFQSFYNTALQQQQQESTMSFTTTKPVENDGIYSSAWNLFVQTKQWMWKAFLYCFDSGRKILLL
jgi:hypothetical protein